MVNTKSVSKKRGKSYPVVSKNKGHDEMERGQVWSIDVLLAVVIFISVIIIFYVTMTSRQKPGLKELEAESASLKVELEKNSEFGFIVKDKIDDAKFQAFIGNASVNYTGLKQKLGVQDDFCIFYEDSDGSIILIGNLVGIGSPDVCIAGYKCGVPITQPNSTCPT
jgi:hypothetical protein